MAIINSGNVISGEQGIHGYAVNDGDVTVTSTGTVNAGHDGITAYSERFGDMTIVSNGGITAGNVGIYAKSHDGGVISVTANGAIQANSEGMRVYNGGVGSTTISAQAITSSTDKGIEAETRGAGLTIAVSGAIHSQREGVDADLGSTGSGILSITTADITSTNGEGIKAINDNGTDILIDASAGSIDADAIGIHALNYGTGTTSLVTGDIDSDTNHGIFTQNVARSTDMSVNTTAGTVSGNSYGIYANNYGSGALSITTADVTGTTAYGIYGYTSTNGTNLTIDTTAGSVSGAFRGIGAGNYGRGSVSITTADVTSTTANAIRTELAATGTSMLVDTRAGTIQALVDGIRVRNHGNGTTTVMTGDVIGTIGVGIYAHTTVASSGLTIDTTGGSISSRQQGIRVLHTGNSDVNVTTASVTNSNRTGIDVVHYGNGNTIVDTTAGSIITPQGGIAVRNTGSGSIAIATGDVTSASPGGLALFAHLGVSGTGVNIDTTGGTITSGTNGDGIQITNQSNNSVNLSTSSVSSGREAIFILSEGGSDISVASGGTVSGTNHSILTATNGGVDATDKVNLAGSLVGDVELNAGNDSFNLMGTGSIVGVGSLDGGNGTGDAFNLISFSSTVDISNVVNFESFSVTGGTSTVAGAAAFDTTSFTSGTTTLANNLNITATSGAFIAAGASVKVGAGSTATITGNLNQGGKLSLADDGTLVVTGNAALQSGSMTTFGLQGSTNGVITSGNLTLDASSQIAVDVTSGNGIANGATFVIGTGTAVTDSGTNAVTDNSFFFDFTHSIVGGNQLVLTTVQNFASCGAVTNDANQRALCDVATGLSGNADANTIINGLGTQISQSGFLAAIDALSPGDAFAASNLGFGFSSMFMNSLTERLGGGNQARPASLNLTERLAESLGDENSDWQLWSKSAFSFSFDDAFTASGSRINDVDSYQALHVLGLDRHLHDGDWSQGPAKIGFAASYGYGWAQEALSGGSTQDLGQHSFSGLAYGEVDYKDYTLSGSLGYAYQWTDSQRHIAFLNQTAKADFGSHQIFGLAAIEPASAHSYSGWDYSPRLSYSLQLMDRDAYSETGSAANLTLSQADYERHEVAARMTLGRNWTEKSRGEAFVELGHALGNDDATIAAFNAGGSAFKVQGVNREDYWVTLGSSFAVTVPKVGQIGFSHETSLGENSHSHDINGWLRYKF